MKYLLIILILFSGCASQKRCTKKFPTTSSRDSIYLEKIVKVPVMIPGDSILIEVPVDCPDQDVIISETGKLKQVIQILNGKLKAKTSIKPDTIFVPTIHTVTQVKEVKVPTPVKYIPKFYKYCMWFSISILIGIAVFIKLKFF